MGVDRATSGLAQGAADAVESQTGVRPRANVHGLDVFPQNPPAVIFAFSGTGMVLFSAQMFLDFLNNALRELPDALPRSHAALVLLNAALINPEPLAQLVLSISAVEMLSQGEAWSDAQRDYLAKLAVDALQAPGLTVVEAKEIAEAIKRSFRVSVRQGVLRLLKKLDLDALKDQWETIYDSRSRIFHGQLQLESSEISQLAGTATMICSKIVLTHAKGEGIPDGLNLFASF